MIRNHAVVSCHAIFLKYLKITMVVLSSLPSHTLNEWKIDCAVMTKMSVLDVKISSCNSVLKINEYLGIGMAIKS